MIIEALKKKQLAEWVNNYVCNKDLPFVTNSATITDYELTGIAEKMKALRANGIRIYFIRFRENDPNYDVYTGKCRLLSFLHTVMIRREKLPPMM
jgi:hypothetical protein